MKSVRIAILVLIVGLNSSISINAQLDDRIQRTREFVVMGYQGIQIELSSGKGPYLRTLMDLLRTPAADEAKTSNQLKSLLKTYPNIMDFSDQVILLAATSPGTSTVLAEIPVPTGPNVYSGDKLVNALEHLTRGMSITVTLKTGEQLKGTFSEYAGKRLWIRGAARRSIYLDDILALDASQH